MSRSPVLTVEEWTPAMLKTLVPKVNERGGKQIGLVSLETNRALQLSTPMMLTWGIADFVDKETGDSDGKYSLALQFPSAEYTKPATELFLTKVKELENKVIDEAVAKAEVWFDEPLSREVLKHNFFPFLKYSKNKDTKKIDLTKAPTMKAKVPFYDGKWGLEIYDTKQTRIFPSEDANLTPLDFVPSKSQVACVLQCGGIWIGGKGWGVTWKVTQCVVKPRENMSISGKCHVFLSEDDRVALEKAPSVAGDDDDDEEEATQFAKKVETTEVADSDNEEAVADDEQPLAAPAPAVAVKKVIKKAAAVPEPEPEPEAAAAAAAAAPAVKKVVKKKVAAP